MSQANILAPPTPPLGSDAQQNMQTLVRAGLPLDEAMRLRVGVGLRPHPDAERFLSVELGRGSDTAVLRGTVDVDFPTGIISALWFDGALASLPFAEALALLIRGRSWLTDGGLIRIDEQDVVALAETLSQSDDWPTQQRTVESLVAGPARDGWFDGKLRRVLVAFGFRVRAIERQAGGARITAQAHRVGHPDVPVGAARRLLQEVACDEAHFARMWNAFQQRVGSMSVVASTPTPTDHGPRGPLPVQRSMVAPRAETAPTVSVVVLTYNGLEDNELCLDSVVRHTHTPYELIVVDNGSSDGTPDFLRRFAADHPQTKLVLNADNRGFAGGNNLGLALARGKYVVLLNNDTVVTDGWLARMVAACERDPGVGLVGPRSNFVSGEQLVRPVPYRDLDSMHDYARRFTEAHLGKDQPVLRLVGFCLMAKRAVLEKIGGLDERYGRGNFEDDDWCLRAHLHGFGARIAHDVFIHHGGSKAFRREGIDYQTQLSDNWEIFKAKWGIDPHRSLQEGYPETLHPPEEVMDFIPLPNIETDHIESAQGRIWEPVEATPAAAPVSAHDINRLFDEAEAAAQADDWAKAAEIFAQMVDQAPNFGPGYVGLASAALATGRIEAGIRALEHACNIYPDQCGLRVQMAVALAHTGQLERSQATFLEVLDMDPDHRDALVSLGHLCRAAGNFVEAVELLGHAARVHPDSPEVIGAIGACALELGDRQGAMGALQRLQQIAPDHDETQLLQAALAG